MEILIYVTITLGGLLLLAALIAGISHLIRGIKRRLKTEDWSKALLDASHVGATVTIGLAGVIIALVLYSQEEFKSRLEVAPRFVFTSWPVRYTMEGDTLVFRMFNYGKGTAYDLAIGLQHPSDIDETGWEKPLSWSKMFPLEDTTFTCIKPDSQYLVRIDLKSNFDGPAQARIKVDSLLNSPRTLGTFRAYIVCRDIAGAQHLVTTLLEPKWKLIKPISEKVFWDNLKPYTHKEPTYFPIYYMKDVEIIVAMTR